MAAVRDQMVAEIAQLRQRWKAVTTAVLEAQGAGAATAPGSGPVCEARRLGGRSKPWSSSSKGHILTQEVLNRYREGMMAKTHVGAKETEEALDKIRKEINGAPTQNTGKWRLLCPLLLVPSHVAVRFSLL